VPFKARELLVCLRCSGDIEDTPYIVFASACPLYSPEPPPACSVEEARQARLVRARLNPS
jgi:hypothetical protein